MGGIARILSIYGFCVSLWAAGPEAASRLAALLREQGLAPEECYRVRDLAFAKEDARIYLTDGYLIFGKPVNGVRVSAVFSADIEGGSAEILLMPPHRSERLSLASFAGTPNLNERFRDALFIFTDDTAEEMLRHIRKTEARRSPERGALLSSNWNPVVANISSSFIVRLVWDLLSPDRAGKGFFFAALRTEKLGNVDLVVDPRAPVQVTLGRLTRRDGRQFYDTWCHFEGRSWRTGRREHPGRDFELANFRIDAALDRDLNLSATTRVTVTPRSNLTSLVFDLSPRMRVTEARVGGQIAEVFQRESLRANLLRGSENDMFLVVPETPLQAGQSYEVEIRHEGVVINSAGNGVYFVGARANWYPNYAMQFARYEISFRHPKDLDLVSTGEVVEERVEGDWRIVRRRTSNPIRLAGFNLGEYESVSVSTGDAVVDVYANRRVEPALEPRPAPVIVPQMPAPWNRSRQRASEVLAVPALPTPNPAARLRELASEIASAFEFFSTMIGPPPVKRLTVSPIPGRFGQGFPGLIYLSTLSYLDPRERPNRGDAASNLFFSEFLQAHEVSHQWWGNVVTADRYEDGWLMEALASYSAMMYLEKRRGPKAMEALLEQSRQKLLAKTAEGRTIESAGPIIWGPRLESSQTPDAWAVITYDKGAWILHMLRSRLGDSAFRSMLAELARRYRYKPVSTQQFQELASSFLPPKSPDPKLEAFFDTWVYNTGIPRLKLDWSVKGKAPAVVVTGTVSHSNVHEDFSAMVPLEIHTASGATVHWVSSTSDGEPFTIKLRQIPRKVLLDPANSILAEK